MRKQTKKMWAFLLTLIMAVSMMATSVTVSADAGVDDMVTGVTIGNVAASYSDFTVTPSEPDSGYDAVTNYYYDAILPTSVSLDSLTVVVNLSSVGTVTLAGESSTGLENSFEEVDLTSPQYMDVTIGGTTRSYRVAACNEGEFYVQIAIRMNLASAWAQNEDNDADMRAAVAQAADALRLPNDDYSETGFVENVKMEAGDTVMDALVKVANENGITLTGAENNYISAMAKGDAIIGEPSCQVNCGSLSGWMYWVDGDLPMVGAGNYTLNGWENIEWKYITDYTTIW